MEEMKNLTPEDLENVAGGNDGARPMQWHRVIANVKTGYLALRSYPSYDDSNIIARIENGVSFLVSYDRTSGEYVWASYNGMDGWVNKKYTASLRGGVTR